MPLLTRSVVDAYNERKATATGSGNYLNPRDITADKTRITILGSESATGWTVWGNSATEPGKRVKLTFASEPSKEEIITRGDEMGAVVEGDAKPRQFFCFFVWNYNAEAVQLFEFSQRGLMDPIIEFLSDEEVEAEPHLFDLVLSATGSGLEKKYSVIPMPGKRRQAATDKTIDAAWQKVLDAGADISVVVSGGDAFKGTNF